MIADYILALSPVAGLALNSVSLLVIYRTAPSFGLLRSEYAGFCIGAGAVLSAHAVVMYLEPHRGIQNIIGYCLLTIISYTALGYCHFHFVNLGETARRIRLLRELYAAGGALTHEQLLAAYSAKEIVKIRLARLVGAGQIISREKHYFVGSPVVMMIAQIMVALKILLLGKSSEFDH